MSKSFGPELMLEFYASTEWLENRSFIRELLERLVVLIKMTSLAPAFVVRSDCSNPRWDPPEAVGVSGFIVLAQSHIAIHTFVFNKGNKGETGYVFMSIFSCDEFDIPEVMEFLSEELGAYRLDSQLAIRGLDFPLK